MQATCTWCNALFVQEVADCQNVAILIIKSHENFAGETLREPHYLAQHSPTTIYLGHLDELHYVFWCIRKSTQYCIWFQQNKMFFLNNHRTAVQKENMKLTGKGLRPLKVLNAN